MQTMFKFTKNNFEDIFLCIRFKIVVVLKNGISDTISFYPNQIKFLLPNIKENKGLIYLFLMLKFISGFPPKIRFKSFRTFKYNGTHHLR